MFELLFKYPWTVFEKGQLVLLGSWPVWVLGLLILAAAALLAWQMRREGLLLGRTRAAGVWLLQTALAALILLLLWHPAVSVATLRPQQNVISVLVDDSQSMLSPEGGTTRLAEAKRGLDTGLLEKLRDRFQVRLYRFGRDLQRVDKPEQIMGSETASRIGPAIRDALADTSTLPLGAIVLMSDGADNSGGIDRETIAEIRQRGIPVHAVGYGPEKISPDIEIRDVLVPARTLADSRVAAEISLLQNGYSSRKARLTVRETLSSTLPEGKVASGKVLASQEITLREDGVPQTEILSFQAGIAGAKSFVFSVEPLDGEVNLKNNALLRLIDVEDSKPKVLYIEGEPRWEFKFIRRAIEEDRTLELVTMLRTTQNKIYYQGAKAGQLDEGFPAKAEDLFQYSGLIIGTVEANYFTPAQQELIREFANRRGGGVLFLGGRSTMAEGGYAASALAELLPVKLPDKKLTFHRDQATFELTPQGELNLIPRLVEDSAKNVDRWKKMPKMADYQEIGTAKPGALVLAEVNAGGRKSPLLVIQQYGRGRSGVFATGGSWRWQMSQDVADKTHEVFWQQLLRWLVLQTPGQVVSSTPRPVLSDESSVPLRVEIRDKEYLPLQDVRVEARIVGPGGTAGVVELEPEPLEEGVYTARWDAQPTGSYVAEVLVKRGEEEVGRDVLMFLRQDGVAEHFRLEQNRELLRNLAEQTGGEYYAPSTIDSLPEKITYSSAGITTRETRDLWNMPIVFLLVLGLRGAEWVLRRKWGFV